MASNIDGLINACLEGDMAIVTSLISEGTPVNSLNSRGFHPIFSAAERGHTDLVELLLQTYGADANVSNATGGTALYVAAQNGHMFTAKVLLDHKARVNHAKYTDGSTPLFMAAQTGHLGVVSLLLENKAAVDQATTTGATPLFIAACNGHSNVVYMLLDNQAYVDQAEGDGITPLYIAAQNDHPSIVSVLLENKASVNQARADGATPLYIAAQKGHLGVVSVLLKYQASTNQAKTDGNTPLSVAAQYGHKGIVEKLIAHGAALNHCDQGGYYPLHRAVHQDHESVAELLCGAGALVDSQTSKGIRNVPSKSTALHIAVKKGNLRIVKILLAHEAAIVKDSEGATPLDLSRQYHFIEIEEELQKINYENLPLKKKNPSPPPVPMSTHPVLQQTSHPSRADRKAQTPDPVPEDRKAQTSHPAPEDRKAQDRTVTEKKAPNSKTETEDEKLHRKPRSVKQKLKALFSKAETRDRTPDVSEHTQQKVEQKGIQPSTLQTTGNREQLTSDQPAKSSVHEPTQLFSEKHKENLMNRAEYFTQKLQFSGDVLSRLIKKGVFGENIQKKIMFESTCDEEISQKILQHLVSAKREDFVTFIEVILQTNQRLLANILYRTLPKEEYSEMPMPELKSRTIPKYKEIHSSEILFDRPHGANENKYHQIGAGAFSVIQLATYTAMDTKVAFKRVKGSEYGGMNDKDIREFMTEASTMYAVRHPDIITIYGTTCDIEKHIYGMVIEYMELGSLYDLMAQIEIPWPVKVRMLNDVSRGLKFLNTPQSNRPYPVTHCDIKASNVLVNDQFCAKVADFGESVLQNITMRTFSNSSGTRGTITHMAPELLNPTDGFYDPTEKSDVWSFGITIFEICAENSSETQERRTPFAKRMNDHQIFGMIGVNRQSPFNEQQMKKIPKDCPPFLIDLLRKCCQVQKDERLNFTEAAKILDHHYIGKFKAQIHQAMCHVHRTYGEKVLGLQFSASDAEELCLGSSDKLTQLLDKVDKLLMSVEESQKSAGSFESKLDELKTLFKLELPTISDKMDRALIESVQQKIDDTALRAKDMKLETAEPSLHKKLNELEHRLTQHITDQMAKMGVYDDSYDFKNSLIRQNYEALVTGIYLDDVVDYLYQEATLSVDDYERVRAVDYLYQEATLSVDDYERVRAQITTRDQNRLLLIKVDASGEDGISKLCEALSSTPQAHLARLLLDEGAAAIAFPIKL